LTGLQAHPAWYRVGLLLERGKRATQEQAGKAVQQCSTYYGRRSSPCPEGAGGWLDAGRLRTGSIDGKSLEKARPSADRPAAGGVHGGRAGIARRPRR
jgi:hypothetical protein